MPLPLPYPLQVRIRVLVQSNRQPVTFLPGPWSNFVPVDGVYPSVTTPPTVGVSSPTSINGLLLVAVLVPVGVVSLVVIFFIASTILWYKKRYGNGLPWVTSLTTSAKPLSNFVNMV